MFSFWKNGYYFPCIPLCKEPYNTKDEAERAAILLGIQTLLRARKQLIETLLDSEELSDSESKILEIIMEE